jgi:probable phosphoglycerate mutase
VREKERSTRVIFVRHGETDFPLDRIYCDNKEDPPLNSVGQDQARQAAQFLKNETVDAIYASPCLRTQMTAKTIAEPLSLEIVVDERYRERFFGIWEGLYFHEIEERYPDEYKAWKVNQAAFKPEDGESVYDLSDRLSPALDGLINKHKGQTIILVAHVGPIRVMIAEAMGMPVEFYRQLQVDPASMSRIDFGVSQNNLIFMNFHARHW